MLIVETGQIVAGAESYVTVAEALVYHANRDNSTWAAASTASQEAALRKATAYVDDNYRARWKGTRVQAAVQPLEWPRFGVRMDGAAPYPTHFAMIPGFFDLLSTTLIPQKLKDATCEAALRALAGPLLADMDMTKQREKIEGLETWYTAAEIATIYPAIDALLSGLLVPTGQGSLTRG